MLLYLKLIALGSRARRIARQPELENLLVALSFTALWSGQCGAVYGKKAKNGFDISSFDRSARYWQLPSISRLSNRVGPSVLLGNLRRTNGRVQRQRHVDHRSTSSHPGCHSRWVALQPGMNGDWAAERVPSDCPTVLPGGLLPVSKMMLSFTVHNHRSPLVLVAYPCGQRDDNHMV